MTNTEAPARWLNLAWLVEMISPSCPVVLVQWEDVLGVVTRVEPLYRDGLVLLVGSRGSREFGLDSDVLVAYE